MAKPPVMSHCNRCQGETHHRLVKEVVKAYDHTDHWGNYTEWTKTFRMLECCGCKDIQMRVEHWHSDIPLDESDFNYYPPRVSRRIPSWYQKLPTDWAALMYEVYGALAADSRRLAVMGARTLIDLYMTETIGGDGGFGQRLGRLVDEGYLAKHAKDTLEAALEAGNAAAHRGHTPNIRDMGLVMDIVENLLQLHLLKGDAVKLKERTPQRPPKPPKATAAASGTTAAVPKRPRAAKPKAP
ncbi:DUF4145 domain-containing protein [Pseudomonas citronellolis]|uniref:DUF4145 domain-containing protein n=1 Tax=Pseudomonas citronellolis TaxID=53408 RepID=A0AAW6P3V9_9PSED|nr:DUF4145 domain-containing protein [Pseudomonas citronellolis]MDF3841702.1 DUF4145 domain-containing protein [Pseudomonas citronellolis]